MNPHVQSLLCPLLLGLVLAGLVDDPLPLLCCQRAPSSSAYEARMKSTSRRRLALAS